LPANFVEQLAYGEVRAAGLVHAGRSEHLLEQLDHLPRMGRLRFLLRREMRRELALVVGLAVERAGPHAHRDRREEDPGHRREGERVPLNEPAELVEERR